jgi:anti-sigma regulatory factor (Ser/Thr protein kinase)
MVELAAISLDPAPASVPRARRFVAAALRNSRADRFVERAGLLTSELVTNVIQHVRSPMTVTVSLGNRRIRVVVSDASSEPPAQRPLGPADLGGRGLWLIDALATSWGFEETDEGKAVWFELAA